MHSRFSASARLLATIAFSTLATAQGTYVNFETPQVKPLAMAVVGGTEYLLACNTPDSSVEIYDPNTASPSTPPVFVDRVPVGQGPASVTNSMAPSSLNARSAGDSPAGLVATSVHCSVLPGFASWTLVTESPM